MPRPPSLIGLLLDRSHLPLPVHYDCSDALSFCLSLTIFLQSGGFGKAPPSSPTLLLFLHLLLSPLQMHTRPLTFNPPSFPALRHDSPSHYTVLLTPHRHTNTQNNKNNDIRDLFCTCTFILNICSVPLNVPSPFYYFLSVKCLISLFTLQSFFFPANPHQNHKVLTLNLLLKPL